MADTTPGTSDGTTSMPGLTADASGKLHATAIADGSLATAGSLPRIVKVDSSTGCTLTRAKIKGLTPAEFEALSNKETDLARVIASAAEAKALGVEERGLATLLTSSVTNIKPLINKVNVAEQSIILPYIQRRQRSVINANYFALESGTSASGETIANYSINNGDSAVKNADWKATVSLGASAWKSELQGIERYFLPNSYVIVNSWNNDQTSGTVRDAFDSQFQVVAAKANGTNKADLILRPVGKDVTLTGGSAYFTGGSIPAHYKPDIGVVQTIANNTNDYEAWCHNQPTDLSQRLIVNWLQTTREARVVNEEYKETLAKVMAGKVNPFLNSMVYHPLAEQNKIASQLSQEQWVRSTWFNQAISDQQTPENYMSLPGVTDPEDDSCTLEYKSNALGIKTLLYEGNRVKDYLGGTLNLDGLFSDLYYLKRNREQDGDQISVIDVMTDRTTANLIFEAMNKYYKDKYEWTVTRNVEINQKVTHDGIILFNYNLYDIPEVGVQMAVFHDPMFDDIIEVGTGMQGSGNNNWEVAEDGGIYGFAQARNRALWLIDWSDVKIGIAGTNAVTRKSPNPEVNSLYKCRMDAVQREYSLRSTKWTTMVDRPHRHLIIENFGPKVSVSALSEGDITKSGSLVTYKSPSAAGGGSNQGAGTTATSEDYGDAEDRTS